MMELAEHSINTLFEQLGLDHSDEAIEAFVSEHKPLPHDILLHEASIWTPAQAAFLKEALEEDADWAIAVDSLDAMLR